MVSKTSKVRCTFQGSGGGGTLNDNLYIKLHEGLSSWRNICVTFKADNYEFSTMQRSNNQLSALQPLLHNRECLNPGLVRQV